MITTTARALLIGAVAALSVAMGAPNVGAEETEPHYVGVGYKIGNGLGFAGGDVIVRAVPHVSLDLQANYLYERGVGTGSGFGFAPTVQFQWKPVGHTPYVAVGLVYARLGESNVTASTTGFLLNAGYEWRFASQVGVLVGGGAARLGRIYATDGVETISEAGGWFFNIEAGVRYYF
jgi:hypothetical protein